MKKRNKECVRRFLLSAILIMTGGSIAGCGGTSVNMNSVSGNAVSEKEVVHNSKAKGRYCTDTNLYVETKELDVSALREAGIPESKWEDYTKPAIYEAVQMRLDGSCKKKLNLGKQFSSLVGVSGNRLYYMTTEQTGNYDEYGNKEEISQIFCVPIYKGQDGYDEINVEEAEVVISKEEGGTLYREQTCLDENRLLYMRDDINGLGYEIVTYDLQKKEIIGLSYQDDWEFNYDKPFKLGDKYIFLSDDPVSISETGDRWEYVLSDYYEMKYPYDYNNRMLCYQCMHIEEDECEYSPGPEYMNRDFIRVYDGENNHTLVTRKELKRAILKAVELMQFFKETELENWELTSLFCDGDRCYIQGELAARHNGVYYMEYLLFSKTAGDDEIRFEREIMDCMRAYERQREGYWYIKKNKQKKILEEKSIVNPVHCRNVVDGKLYFDFHDEKDICHVACYESKTGHSYEITKQDKQYYEQDYDTKYEYAPNIFSDEWEKGFGYEDIQYIVNMSILPHEDAYFEEVEVLPGEKKK